MSLRTASTTAALAVLLAASGCKPPTKDTRAPMTADAAKLRAAELERRLKEQPNDVEAARELAHLYWLHLRQPSKAAPLLDRLAAQDDAVAQMSRLLMADARLDFIKVREMTHALIRGAARPNVPDSERATRVGMAELAARYLAENHGELPDDDTSFPKFFETIDLAALPPDVSQPLLSLRASIARRLDQEYLKYYDQQGCVRAWSVGEVEGTLATFELRKAAADPNAFTPDPTATLTTLACAIRTWNPSPRAGMRRLRTHLDVPGDTIRLGRQPGAGAGLRRRHAGVPQRPQRPLAERREHAGPQGRPGVHRLDVHTAFPREKGWLLVRATDHRGQAIPARAEAATLTTPFTGAAIRPRTPFWPYPDKGLLAGPAYAPLRMLLAASDAMADGNTDDAEGFTRAMPRPDPSSRRATSWSRRSRSAIRRASERPRRRASAPPSRRRWPSIPGSRGPACACSSWASSAARRARSSTRSRRSARRRCATCPASCCARRVHGPRQRAPRRRGAGPRRRAAPRALRGAQGPARGGPAPRRRRGQEDALTAKIERCPGTTGTRARLAARRGRYDEARALFKKLLDRTPDDVEVMAELAEVAISDGKLDEALALRRKILA
jgi:hypothetical protein